MGFIKSDGYNVSNLGVAIPTAYAMIENIITDIDGNAKAILKVQTSRTACESKAPLETVEVNFAIDKAAEQSVYKQGYIAAKSIFDGWQDDILEETAEADTTATGIEETTEG